MVTNGLELKANDLIDSSVSLARALLNAGLNGLAASVARSCSAIADRRPYYVDLTWRAELTAAREAAQTLRTRCDRFIAYANRRSLSAVVTALDETACAAARFEGVVSSRLS